MDSKKLQEQLGGHSGIYKNEQKVILRIQKVLEYIGLQVEELPEDLSVAKVGQISAQVKAVLLQQGFHLRNAHRIIEGCPTAESLEKEGGST